jgi:hypothetical protein
MKEVSVAVRMAVLLSCCSMLLSCGGGGGGDTAAPPASAYYVDSAGGSDANSGTDATHAWQSLDKVSAVSAGATVYLKRGSVWYGQLTVPASSITIDAYGAGALPVLDGSRPVGAWTAQGGGIYSATVALAAGEGLGNLSEDGVMMSYVEWDTDAATTFAAAANGSYSYQYPDTLYIKRAMAPTGVYRASVKFFGITAASRSDVTVRNVQATRFSLNGINFVDCVRCAVYGVVVTQGGGATIAANLYAGNGIEFDNDSSSGVVDGADVSEIFDSCISPQTYASGKTMSSISISNATLDRCGFAGVEVSVLSNGGSTGSSISGVTLSGLTITDAGKGWSGRRYGSEGNGIRIIADAGAGTMSGIAVDTTTVSGAAGDGIRLAGNIGTVALHRIEVTGNTDGISMPDPAGTTGKLLLTSSLVHHNARYGLAYNSPSAAGFELYQNTFAENAGANIVVFSQAGTAKLRNNLFFSATAQLYAAAAFAGDMAMDNNCYNDLANMISYNGSAYNSLAAFHAAVPALETNGVAGAVGLNNVAAGDFTLTGASVCKTSGSAAVGVASDYSGYAFASPPSSGAYQFR